jgi:hypothetical protein
MVKLVNSIKSKIAILIIALNVVTAFGSNQNDFELYRFDNASRENVVSIEKMGGTVSKYIPNDFAEVYLNQNQYNELVKKGYDVYSIVDRNKLYADSLYEATKHTINPMLNYHTYQEITDTLQIWAQQFSHIAELHSIGQTTLGREMWILKISDNVNVEEAEPEFKYISTMHGDEVVGKELMIELIRMLLNEYGISQRITDLVNNTEIWIMPNMNFDGTELHQRRNANNVDLNRNFPDREYGNPPFPGHPYSIQQETQNVIDFVSQHNFVLSANFHCGVLVVNYPWDKRLPGDGGVAPYAGSPDDTTFIDLALTYAEHNPPMYNSPVFPDGITNGAVWYEISGGMQDWNYFEHNCKEITIEVSDIDWPHPSQLPQFWLDNKESLLAYMEKVHTGVKGIVTDGLTGLPIPATITILETGSGVNTDPDFGDYYKVISPGIYNLLMSSPGYRDSVVTNVLVDSFPATVVDVQLLPEITFNLEILVLDNQTSNPLQDVKISLFKNDNLFLIDSTNINGLVSLNIAPDSFNVKIENEFYFDVDTLLVIYSDTSVTFEMQEIIPAIVKGNVFSSTGGSVDGAIIYCDGKIDSIEISGNFRLERIKPGKISTFTSLLGHITSRLDTIVNNGDSLDLTITLQPGNNEVFDDFESPSLISYTESGDWEKGIPSTGPMSAWSGVNLCATNLSGNYSNGNLLSILETNEIVIFGINDPVLKFYHWYDIEYGSDGGNIKISTDNGNTWQIIIPGDSYPVASLPAGSGNPLAGESVFSGFQQFWNEATFELDNYSAYPVIKLRFDFGVDFTGNAAGWYIDDLQIYDGIVVKTEEPKLSISPIKPSIHNYPNPFNPVTHIHYDLPSTKQVKIELFNLLGQKVVTLVNEEQVKEKYKVEWDGKNELGVKVSAGVYFCRFEATGKTGNFIQTRKMILLK